MKRTLSAAVTDQLLQNNMRDKIVDLCMELTTMADAAPELLDTQALHCILRHYVPQDAEVRHVMLKFHMHSCDCTLLACMWYMFDITPDITLDITPASQHIRTCMSTASG